MREDGLAYLIYIILSNSIFNKKVCLSKGEKKKFGENLSFSNKKLLFKLI